MAVTALSLAGSGREYTVATKFRFEGNALYFWAGEAEVGVKIKDCQLLTWLKNTSDVQLQWAFRYDGIHFQAKSAYPLNRPYGASFTAKLTVEEEEEKD